jgi:hypothetical protein
MAMSVEIHDLVPRCVGNTRDSSTLASGSAWVWSQEGDWPSPSTQLHGRDDTLDDHTKIGHRNMHLDRCKRHRYTQLMMRAPRSSSSKQCAAAHAMRWQGGICNRSGSDSTVGTRSLAKQRVNGACLVLRESPSLSTDRRSAGDGLVYGTTQQRP